MSDTNNNSKNINVFCFLIKLIAILCIFSVLIIVVFIFIAINTINQFEKDFESRYVYSESEMVSCLYNRYGKVTLLDLYYTDEPEPQRICTFKDEKHGFTFTATAIQSDKNRLIAVPLYLKTIVDDYEEQYFSCLEDNLRPILEQEGIEFFSYSDIRNKNYL